MSRCIVVARELSACSKWFYADNANVNVKQSVRIADTIRRTDSSPTDTSRTEKNVGHCSRIRILQII